MEKLKKHRVKIIAAVAAFVVAAIVVRVIFVLTFQTPEETTALSNKTAQYPAMAVFLEKAGQYVPWTIRQWAHVFEYLFVGLTVGIFYGCLIRKTWIVAPVSAATCAVISFVDQYVRIYIIGRHFDRFDMALDAMGYGAMILLVCIVHGVVQCVRRRKSRRLDSNQ